MHKARTSPSLMSQIATLIEIAGRCALAGVMFVSVYFVQISPYVSGRFQ